MESSVFTKSILSQKLASQGLENAQPTWFENIFGWLNDSVAILADGNIAAQATYFTALVALIVGIFATIVAALTILSNRAGARRQATIEMLERIERDGEIIEHLRTFNRIANSPEGLPWHSNSAAKSPSKKDKDKETIEQKNREAIRVVLNHYELIAVGISKGVLDEKVYRLWFKSSYIKAWQVASTFVMSMREATGQKYLYQEFERMAEKFQGKGSIRGILWTRFKNWVNQLF